MTKTSRKNYFSNYNIHSVLEKRHEDYYPWLNGNYIMYYYYYDKNENERLNYIVLYYTLDPIREDENKLIFEKCNDRECLSEKSEMRESNSKYKFVSSYFSVWNKEDDTSYGVFLETDEHFRGKGFASYIYSINAFLAINLNYLSLNANISATMAADTSIIYKKLGLKINKQGDEIQGKLIDTFSALSQRYLFNKFYKNNLLKNSIISNQSLIPKNQTTTTRNVSFKKSQRKRPEKKLSTSSFNSKTTITGGKKKKNRQKRKYTKKKYSKKYK